MAESKNIHWTENEELLEQFVIGRLEASEAAKLEEHLQECGQCRMAVLNERDLVVGIRLVGRESMKRRLAQRLEQQKGRNIGWYRVVGVAAGIVLLVTVGIYNRWFTGSETQMEKRDRADRTEPRTEPAPLVSPQGQVTNAEKPSEGAAKRAVDEEGQRAPGLAAGATKASGAESGQIAEAQVDKLKDLKATDAAREGESREKKDRIVAATVAATAAATWLQGTVISERDESSPAPSEMAAKAADERTVLRKGKEEYLFAGKAAKAGAKENAARNFVVTQRLVSDLPPSQQTQRQQASFVQTLLQKNPTGTQMTVYLDSLLTKKDFDQTHVQTIGEDSIILNLGNRRVGYKLPPDWTGQGMQQTRKEK